ncbi:MAG: hypothetical protein CM15mP81_00030 [Alphaproteobacteria bacterium]|nr:MAG: hypothetical protein CM15mP81_00030 [Alphaproteobacteria bacterium]
MKLKLKLQKIIFHGKKERGIEKKIFKKSDIFPCLVFKIKFVEGVWLSYVEAAKFGFHHCWKIWGAKKQIKNNTGWCVNPQK